MNLNYNQRKLKTLTVCSLVVARELSVNLQSLAVNFSNSTSSASGTGLGRGFCSHVSECDCSAPLFLQLDVCLQLYIVTPGSRIPREQRPCQRESNSAGGWCVPGFELAWI
jgi:hypothetical protein